MLNSFISLLLLTTIGCSGDTGTSPSLEVLDLDTHVVANRWVFPIQKYEDEEWKKTEDYLHTSMSWRFTDSWDKPGGGIIVTGHYSLGLANSTTEDVQFTLRSIQFNDQDSKEIAVYEIVPEESIIIPINTPKTFSADFDIELNSLKTANQIAIIGPVGAAIFIPK